MSSSIAELACSEGNEKEKLEALANSVLEFLKARRDYEACRASCATAQDPYYGEWEAWLKWHDEATHAMVSAEVDMYLLAHMALKREDGENKP